MEERAFDLKIKGTSYLFWGFLISFLGPIVINTVIFGIFFLQFRKILEEGMPIIEAFQEMMIPIFLSSFVISLIFYLLLIQGWKNWRIVNKKYNKFYYLTIIALVLSIISIFLTILFFESIARQIIPEKVSSEEIAFLQGQISNIDLLFSFPEIILILLIYYGVYLLGKDNNVSLLKVSAILLIISIIILQLGNISILLFLIFTKIPILEFFLFTFPLFVIIGIFGFIGFIALILIIVGLYILKSKIKKEKVAILPPTPV